MALPNIMRRLFRNDGYGPLLKPEIIPITDNFYDVATDAVVSPKWVKDLVRATFYVDASVASSGDGLTAATAFKTIGEAITAAAYNRPSLYSIYIAGGIYTETVAFYNKHAILNLTGNVTINGILACTDGSRVLIKSENDSTLTVSNVSEVVASVHSAKDSWLYIAVPLTVTCNYYGNAITVSIGSACSCTTVTINGSALVSGVVCTINSFFYVESLTCHQDNSNRVPEGVVTIDHASSIYAAQSINIWTNTQTQTGILVRGSSFCQFGGTSNYIRANHTNGIHVYAQNHSNLRLVNMSFDCSTACSRGIYLDSHCAAWCSGSFTAAGNFKYAFANVVANSVLDFPSNVSVTNNASGKRYDVSTNSFIRIYLNSAGKNRLPGKVEPVASAAQGSVDSTSIYA